MVKVNTGGIIFLFFLFSNVTLLMRQYYIDKIRVGQAEGSYMDDPYSVALLAVLLFRGGSAP